MNPALLIKSEAVEGVIHSGGGVVGLSAHIQCTALQLIEIISSGNGSTDSVTTTTATWMLSLLREMLHGTSEGE